jgi:hypothetical protein
MAFGLSDTKEGRDLIPFSKYFEIDRNLISELRDPPTKN